MKKESHYIVAGVKSWNRRIFNRVISAYPGRWHFVGDPNGLAAEIAGRADLRYIFFLHWSWKVPSEIVRGFECVCFHMTDVPYGRGGSPLQNLILRGHRQTKLTALRMVEDFDAGPVYLQKDLSLEGNAEEIYIRAAYLSAHMIRQIIETEPLPAPQTGEAVVFERRRPEDSQIPKLDTLQGLHDFIRMHDAEGYPACFIEYKGFRFEFSRAAMYDGRIVADATITRPGDETS